MARARWNASFTRCASALLLASLAAVALRGEAADACGWDGPTVEDLTTFDPRIAEGPERDELYYNPDQHGWGELCGSCAIEAMQADWQSYLGGAVTREDWDAVLLRGKAAELKALSELLAPGARRGAAPAAYAKSSLWKDAGARPKLRAAVELVRLAREVEAFAERASDTARGASEEDSAQSAATPAKAAKAAKAADLAANLATMARAGMRAAREPFLVQRYAFQLMKVLFYQQRWTDVIVLAEKQAAQLATPSQDLAWRARYYQAGALMRSGLRARGNLELARIHAGYAALSGPAANDFRPMEEADWRESLRLARTVKEKVELWRLVGITRDGVVAMREIVKLDATSPLLALLMVRELERIEARGEDPYAGPMDAKELAQQQRALAELEQLAQAIAAAPRADRPWLMTLIAGHLAAKRGDLAAAKRQLLAALSARPDDARVKSQVHASLAMALVTDTAKGSGGKVAKAPSMERANAVADEMLKVAPEFARLGKLREQVRGTLATAYLAAGKLVEAELLRPGILEGQPATAGKWQEPAFLKAMIAQARKQEGGQAAPFDRFLVEQSYSRPQLEAELALRYLTAGAFGEAARWFAAGTAASGKLGTDPFVMRLVDCHDCDHEQYANAPWTHASFAARLVQLEKAAGGKGEPAAAAALALGNALYNITWYGNARVVLDGTHQQVETPRAAERWYKRAFELSRDRELRAQAAFFAAKAELGAMISAAEDAASLGEAEHLGLSELPKPKTWFPVLDTFADTAYYQEVLAECSNFSSWAAHPR
jgi:hypothetical protein